MLPCVRFLASGKTSGLTFPFVLFTSILMGTVIANPRPPNRNFVITVAPPPSPEGELFGPNGARSTPDKGVER